MKAAALLGSEVERADRVAGLVSEASRAVLAGNLDPMGSLEERS